MIREHEAQANASNVGKDSLNNKLRTQISTMEINQEHLRSEMENEHRVRMLEIQRESELKKQIELDKLRIDKDNQIAELKLTVETMNNSNNE